MNLVSLCVYWTGSLQVLKEDIDEIQLATDPDPDNNNNNSSNSSSSSSSNDPVGARSQAPSVGAMAIACVGAGIVLTLAVLQKCAASLPSSLPSSFRLPPPPPASPPPALRLSSRQLPAVVTSAVDTAHDPMRLPLAVVTVVAVLWLLLLCLYTRTD